MYEKLGDPAQLPAIDLKHNTRLIGDEQKAKEMLALFHEKLPRDFALIEFAFIQQDLIELAECAHRLVSASAYSGVPAIRAAAKALEYTAEHQSIKEIQAVYEVLKEQILRFYQAFDLEDRN